MDRGEKGIGAEEQDSYKISEYSKSEKLAKHKMEKNGCKCNGGGLF